MLDELAREPHAAHQRFAGVSHLTTDGHLEDLHAFAARLGMRRQWLCCAAAECSERLGAPHYALTKERRDLALALGAVFVPAAEQARRRGATP
jgi:hypothetical protein